MDGYVGCPRGHVRSPRSEVTLWLLTILAVVLGAGAFALWRAGGKVREAKNIRLSRKEEEEADAIRRDADALTGDDVDERLRRWTR
jgi:hypothetical protein